MWETLLYDLLNSYLPAIIFGMVGAVSTFFFLKMKKKGYLIMGVGSALLAVGWIALPIVISYIYLRMEVVLTYIIPWGWIYFFNVIFRVVPALLILAGLILLYKESKQN